MAIAGLGIGPCVEKRLHNLDLAMVLPEPSGGKQLQQPLFGVAIWKTAYAICWGESSVVAGLGIGLGLEKCLHNFDLSIQARAMQWPHLGVTFLVGGLVNCILVLDIATHSTDGQSQALRI